MFKVIYLFFLVSNLVLQSTDSAKILAVFQWPSISHHVVLRHITEELARRGHEVTVITTDAAFPEGQAPPNLTEIELHDESYEIWTKAKELEVKEDFDILGAFKYVHGVMMEILEKQFRSDKVQKLLNETKHFDLILTEALIRPSLVFAHFYKAPVIQISTLGSINHNDWAFGIPTHPILYPPVTSATKHYNHTILEKIYEIYQFCLLNWHISEHAVRSEDKLLRNVFGPDIPSVDVLYDNVAMLFLNTHPMWASNIPVPPNVIYIWGIHKKPEKELPQDLKSFLDSSKNGVIYMSFGTNSPPSALPAETIQAIVQVFSELSYDILWKWDKEELPGRTNNIRIGKWFPQSDLLRHPKVKLFITHCGLQSTDEAISAGVPLVGIPLVADQHFNMEKYLHFKIAEKVDINTMTSDDFKKAVETVLKDDSYRENIIKLRNIMRDEPQSALERAVWYTEYVLRHKGAKHLRAAGANVSWIQYYDIPLVLTLFIGLTASCVVVLTFSRFITDSLKPRSKVKCN